MGKKVIALTLSCFIILSFVFGVNVYAENEEIVGGESIELNKANLEMVIGRDYVLCPIINEKSEYGLENVKWISENAEIATVNQDGRVTPISEGVTIIKIISEDNLNYGYCSVKVVDESSNIFIDSFTFDEENIDVEVGSEISIGFNIEPINVTDKEIFWISDNEDIVKINSTGNIKAIGEGIAKVSAVTADGGKYDQCIVNVIAPFVEEESEDLDNSIENEEAIEVENEDTEDVSGNNMETAINVKSIFIDKSNIIIDIEEEVILKAEVLPNNATNKNIFWESDNEDVAIVDTEGKVIGKKEGTAVITITSEDGNAYTYVAVEVCNNTDIELIIDNIKLNKSQHTMSVGEAVVLEATIEPHTAKDEKIIWKSSDENIAKVDSNGTVVAVKAGEVNIIVSNEDNTVTTHCKININDKKDKNNDDKSTDKKLPQTGQNNYLGIVGLFMLGLGTIFIKK